MSLSHNGGVRDEFLKQLIHSQYLQNSIDMKVRKFAKDYEAFIYDCLDMLNKIIKKGNSEIISSSKILLKKSTNLYIKHGRLLDKVKKLDLEGKEFLMLVKVTRFLQEMKLKVGVIDRRKLKRAEMQSAAK